MRDFLDFSRPGYNPLQCALGYFHIWREGEDNALAALDQGPSDHNLADSKGMWFYHMVRQRIGDTAFFAALKELQSDFRTKPMRVSDIRAAFLAATPSDSGLKTFLGQWLDRTGAPVLEMDWWSLRRQPADRRQTPTGAAQLKVRQVQPGEVYHLDLEVRFTLRDSSTVLDTLHLRDREQSFELEFPSRVLDVEADPNQKLLLWRPKYGPRPWCVTLSEVKGTMAAMVPFASLRVTRIRRSARDTCYCLSSSNSTTPNPSQITSVTSVNVPRSVRSPFTRSAVVDPSPRHSSVKVKSAVKCRPFRVPSTSATRPVLVVKVPKTSVSSWSSSKVTSIESPGAISTGPDQVPSIRKKSSSVGGPSSEQAAVSRSRASRGSGPRIISLRFGGTCRDLIPGAGSALDGSSPGRRPRPPDRPTA